MKENSNFLLVIGCADQGVGELDRRGARGASSTTGNGRIFRSLSSVAQIRKRY
ncbi:hypothetical protein J4H92_10020 [Leucobacter weissii]|uniref:Uncharacterized protein n=1 Tax=Leucobacter weissii TaxID=1983706 RepID=A0A939MLV7_9MICO|nr:hypothetical protein [Leucobacter weissii]MBO1902280.1 hypothetical protein [Leucobacter weissii]